MITSSANSLNWKSIFSSILLAVMMITQSQTMFAQDKTTFETTQSDIVIALKAATDDIQDIDQQIETIAWLQEMGKNITKRVPDHEYRFRLLRTVLDESIKAKIDPQIALSVMEVESNFNEKATSNVGAQGLMQIMPFWKKEIGNEWDDLYHMETNIRYGCQILSYYLDRFSPSVSRALAGYNGSLGRDKYPNKVFARLKRHWEYEPFYSLEKPEIVAIETGIE